MCDFLKKQNEPHRQDSVFHIILFFDAGIAPCLSHDDRSMNN